MTAQSQPTTSFVSDFSSAQIEAGLINFLTALSQQNCSGATIRNYRSDIRQFYKFMEIEELEDLFTHESLKNFVLAQRSKGLKDSSVTRKIASITQFAIWSKDQGLIDQDIAWMHETSIESLLNPKLIKKNQTEKSGNFLKFWHKKEPKPTGETQITDTKLVNQFAAQAKPVTKKSFATTANLILPYLNLGLMILFFIGLGFLGYNQLVKEAPVSLAYPTSPVRADRVLSFQGRLTDTAQNPITTATSMEFKIWDQLSGGTEGSCDGVTDCKYQTGVCSVTPDQDGIFNVGIGDDCGIEIDDPVFTENAALWLEVKVGSETLAPRQPIRTVPFAVNSETVQGFPVSATEAATINTILVMDEGGNVVLGENNPKLTSISGTFTISGGILSLDGTTDILFSDARVTNLPLSLVDTQIDPALPQAIVDAINETYALSVSGSLWSTADNLLYPTQYWVKDVAIGGNSTASADIFLGQNGNAVFNEQGNDVDFRIESDAIDNALFLDGTTGYVGIGDGSPDHMLDVAGNIGLDANSYINWGDTDGTAGYGFRDNSGTLQFKNNTGTWIDIGVATNSYWQFNSGSLSPNPIWADINLGDVASSAAKVSLAGSLDRGRAVAILNQTEDQDIFAASASGVNRFVIQNDGDIGIGTITPDRQLEIENTNGAYFRLTDSGISYLEIQGGNQGSFFPSINTGTGWSRLDFGVQGGIDLTLNAGNVGINDVTPDHMLDVAGNIGLDANGYINWGDTDGTAGYGFRDSSGTLQFKNNAGTWTDIGTASNTYWQLNNGSLSPFSLTADINLGNIATDSAKISLAGSLDRGKAAVIINQTENQDIFTASDSGTTRFVIQEDGDVGIGTAAPTNALNIVKDQNAFTGVVVQNPNTGGSAEAGFQAIGDGQTIKLTTNPTSPTAARLAITGSFPSLAIDTNGTERLRVTATGMVGIGTTEPTSRLAVNGDFSANAATISATYAGGTPLTLKGGPSGTANILNITDDLGNSLGYFGPETGDSGLFRVQYGGGGSSYLDMTSSFGSPKLTLNRDSTANDSLLQFYTADTPKWLLGNFATASNDNFIIGNPTTAVMTIEDGGVANTLYLDSTGFVGLGDTTPDHKLDVAGNIGLDAGGYINWGDTDGTAGYGFRDNSGTLQFKNNAGAWTDIGLSSNAYWQLNNGSLSPFSLTADINLGNIATDSAKISLAGSLDRGKAAVIINQTENQDIFTASSGGITRFTLDYGGNATLSGSLKLGDQLQLANFASDPVVAMGEGSVYYNNSNNTIYYYNGTTWTDLSSGSTNYWQLNSGSLSPVSTGYEVNLGNIATDSAKISLAGAHDRGKAAVIINQTENQDIFAASSSGVNRFVIQNDGDVGIGTIAPPAQLSVKQTDVDTSQLGLGVMGTWSVGTHSEITWFATESPSSQVAGIRVEPDLAGDWNMSFLTTTTGGGGYATRMTIDDLGNVGIGDTTPDGMLDVEGKVTGKALVQFNELGNQDIITASVAGVTRMRVDNDGYVWSQRFVDLANSAYFLDPAATGTSLNAAGDGKLEGGQIYLFNTNTYVSGDGTDLTFKDNYLTSAIALSETGTTQLHAGFTMNSLVAALNELMNMALGDETNIFLNSFREQQNEGMLYKLFQDGVADEFEGLEAIDTNLSAYTYDSVNDWFSRANPTSDVVHDTQQEFLEGSFLMATVSATPTLELAKTANVGTGADGDATISATKNLNSHVVAAGRNFADAIAYKVTGIASNAVSTDYTPHGIVAGDEVILINMQGDGTNYANVGTYEFLTVNSVSGLNLAFTTSILSTYGVGGNSNLSGQDIMIQRVPQYDDVTVESGGTLTTGDWDNLATVPTSPTSTAGYQTGLLVFRATGTVTVASGGSIDLSGKGYRGGVGGVVNGGFSYRGESTALLNDTQTSTPTTEGGGGGSTNCQGGGGGAYAANATSGTRSGTSCGNATNRGVAYGDANLTKLNLGSGGGGGGVGYNGAWAVQGGTGGDGGGALFIIARQVISSAGSIISNGTVGGAGGTGDTIPAGGGGGGAGGAIHLQARTVNVSGTITASAGTGGQTNTGTFGAPWTDAGAVAHGGPGSVGRIKITGTDIIGTTTPAATTAVLSLYEDYGIYTSNEIHTPNTVSFDLLEWTENLNTYGEVQVMTRSGLTADSTDGTWQEWRPIVTNVNEKIIDNMNTQGNWSSYTPFTIAQDIQNEFGYNNESFRTIESGGLDGAVTIERNIDNGDGHDGSITVSASKNINTDVIAAGRADADGVTYAVSSISSLSLVTSATPNGIIAGDEVMLINLQGDSTTTYDNTGNYEFLKVSSVSGTTLNFETAISNIYGYGSNLDLSGQKIVVQRVPQYYNVTIQSGGIITTNDWAGTSGGLIVFRVAGTLDVQSGGSITASGKGYRGGAGISGSGVASFRGESTAQLNTTQTTTPTIEGGGGGSTNCQGGGGGAYGANATSGTRSGTSCSNATNRGVSYGDANLAQLNLGSGGGGGGSGYNGAWAVVGGTGGDGGGAIYITANTITASAGSITNDGTTGGAGGVGDTIPAGGGGGGSGGATYLAANVVNVSGTITAAAGAGGTTNTGTFGAPWTDAGAVAHGGNGSVGRIRIDANRVTGSTSPTYTDGTTLNDYHPYGIFTSSELQATSAAVLDLVSWTETLGNVGEIQIQTRTGNSTDATDGTWEAWKPVVNGTNEVTLDTMNTHTTWTGTNMTVAEGDTTRNLDNFEDEDEGTAGNLAKFSTSTENGYAETDLGSGSTVNLTNYDYLTFWVRSDVTSDKLTFSFGEATGNEQSEVVTIDQINVWQKVYWDISDIAASTRDSVRYLRITNNDIPAVVFYLDNIRGGRYITSNSGYQIPSTVNNYIQYRAILSTTTVTAAPILENLTINYRTSTAHTMVLEGDAARNINYFEDEDEATVANITKISFTAQNGYIERDLGGGNEVDLSNYDYISFWIKTTEIGEKWRIGMGESAATDLTQNIEIETAETWQKVFWDLTDISTASRNAVRYFRLTQIDSGSTTVYLDDLAANRYESSPTNGTIGSSANEYFQYRVILSTTTNTVTPTVSSITVNYTDQLGHTDNTQSAFDAGTEFQNETTVSNTIQTSNNRPNVGLGEDGSITVSTSVNINTDVIASGRAYADGVTYAVSSLGTNVATVSAVPNGIKNGDEIMLINLQGDSTNYSNVGNYEFLTVSSVNSTRIQFTTNLTGTYGVGGNTDLTGQKIAVQRVPHYNNVTIANGGTLTANDWAGTTGGLLIFRASGTVNIEGGGFITMDGKGYRGGAGITGTGINSFRGESTGGTNTTQTATPTTEGGGGGTSNCQGGGGAGYATNGTSGTRSGTSCANNVNRGVSYGDANLVQLSLGSGGGGGGAGHPCGSWGCEGGAGGDGGGIVYIAANTIIVENGVSLDGTLSTDGNDGGAGDAADTIPAGGGGGGAGGSMFLIADTVTIEVNTTAGSGTGGQTNTGTFGAPWTDAGAVSHGGNGSVGRIRIDANSVTGTSTPTYVDGTDSGYYYPYSVFTSDEINTAGAQAYDALTWIADLGTGGMVQFMTRSGSTADSTDGTWQEWRPLYATNEAILQTANTHGDWTGYTPLSKIDDTRAEFDAVSAEKYRVSTDTTPSLYLDRYVDDGDGSDGAITISATKDINADLIATGRTGQADGIAYKIDAATASGTVVGVTNAPNGIVAGDEVLLINLQGATGDFADVGNYEFLEVASVNGSEVTFKTSIVNSYDGTTPANQKVVIQRVPQYTNVTIASGGILTTGEWDAFTTTPTGTAGYRTGVLAFRATGTVTVQLGGSIHTDGKGYRGGAGITGTGVASFRGESTGGLNTTQTTTPTSEGGGGGSTNCQGGGGGAYGTVGSKGTRSGTSCSNANNQGAAYGDANLAKLNLGSGGGGGGAGHPCGSWGCLGGTGGDGGGAIFIAANTTTIEDHPVSTDGFISSKGTIGGAGVAADTIPAGGGGGGAGGAIYIQTNQADFPAGEYEGGYDVFSVDGGGGQTNTGTFGAPWTDAGAVSHGGDGGDGRIRVDVNETIEGTTTFPTYTAGISNHALHRYGIFTSDELSTTSTTDFKDIEWFENIDTSYSDVQVQTRSGNTADSTTGTWEAWKPATNGVNIVSLDNMNTHTNWTGTNLTVTEGDVTRDKNFFEDEDEATAGNLTKLSSSTVNGRADRDLGSGNEVNLSAYNYLSFWVRGSKDNATLKLGMGEAAATEQEETVIIEAADTWQKVYWDLSDMTTAARDSIRYLRFTYLDDSTGTVDFYLDNINGTDVLSEPTSSDITSSAANYVQYRLIFSTTDTTSTLTAPAVYSIKLNYVTPSAVFYSQEGDVTRNVDGYEDEDEGTATNITRVVASSTESDGNYVEAVISSTDLTNYDYLSFWIRTSASATEIPMRIGFGELESDEQQMDFVVETPFQWQKVFFDISDIAAGNKNAVTKLRITNLAPVINDIYIDDFTANRYITTSPYQPNTNANTYFQYRAILTSTDLTSFPSISQVSIAYSGESNVISQGFEANTLPRRVNLVSWADLGTGSIDYWASRDNGTTWTQVTMTEQATESGDLMIYSGFADITAQPAGTQMRWKARITGNAILKSMAMRWESGGGADLAEWYPTTDKTIEAAEVVSADTTSTESGYIVRTTKAYDPGVIGIISTAPGVQIGEKAENTKRVALAGRVPVLVASDSAAITPGDFITSSDTPGRAMKALKTGYTIGKAVEPWSPESGKEYVMVFVNLGTYLDPDDISGGVDHSSLEEIFGEETADAVNLVNASGSGETASDSGNLSSDNTASGSGEINTATDSAEASISGVLNSNIATPSATLIKESLTSRLKKLADERLSAFFGWEQETATVSGDLNAEIDNDSITKYQSDLFEAREKFIAYGEKAENTIGATTINAYNSLNAARATIYGKLITSSADIYGKLTAVSGQFVDIFANVIGTGELQTSLISPIADDGSIHVKLGANKDASSSAKPALTIENSAGSSVTSIDEDGNIITLGTIISKENKTSTITAEVIFAKDATISGNLDASSARIQALESRLAQVERIEAETAEIVNATISGTLFAENIDSFSEKVAAAIEEPSLLAKLTGNTNQTPVESVESYFASHSAFLADLDTSSPTRLALSDLTLGEDDLVIDAAAAYINQYLDVNGSAYVSERLGIGQSLVLSDSMFITAGSIDYAPAGVEKPTLAVQPSGKGVLSLMGNLFTLDDTGFAQLTGDLHVSGDVKVGGTLLANLLKLNDFNNPFQVQLATISGEILGDQAQVQESRFEIINELGVPVATISAQGRAEFASGLGIGSEDLESSSESATIESEKTSGTAIIRANSSEIVIKSKIVTGKSLIYLTPLGSTNNQVLYIKEITQDNPETAELESAFKVGFDQAISNDLKFNWWIVN